MQKIHHSLLRLLYLANIQLVNVLSKIDIFKQCPTEIAIVAKGGKPPAFNIFSLQCYQYS